MFLRRIYYRFKPFLPEALRIAFRRALARRQRRLNHAVWPVDPAAGHAPKGWPGWPGGKRFAFVLTHDVEGQKGLDQCRRLMDLDIEFGFRACFNFVPEGDYNTSKEFRAELAAKGFEVGLHDLRHDGKLYDSSAAFKANAQRINRYLKEWNCLGFRSGFMHHNLEWLGELDVLYDSSTFDTDPFEPQPDAAQTIFPFWVDAKNGRPGYVELPYTLPQDFSLFILLQERSPEIWKRKLDWIAAQGGMALIDVHPDYLSFGDRSAGDEYPIGLYREFLSYVKTRYADSYWHALPREVATYVAEHTTRTAQPAPVLHTNGHAVKRPRRIWIDLDNTPHIPFFKPIIRELESRGYEVNLTARDAFQVCDLAARSGLKFLRVGHHYGKNRFLKLWGIIYRALQLLPFALKHRPGLALSHGARSQILLANLLGIPSVLILDYEHARPFPFSRPTWEIVPDAICNGFLSPNKRVRKYSGIKEDVYVPDFRPDPAILKQLGLPEETVVVTVRPPATEAHYHNPEGEVLFERFMDRLCATPGTVGVLLPRNKRQEETLRAECPHWFAANKVIVPSAAVDGLNLLWHSDLVVSGGGTMNREAAALGVPVYSIFRGKIGAVDRQLREEGRLVLIETPQEIDSRIPMQPRKKEFRKDALSRAALDEIVDHVDEIFSLCGR
jgi:predicted glycosyltransferase